jgi:hypothetical protein
MKLVWKRFYSNQAEALVDIIGNIVGFYNNDQLNSILALLTIAIFERYAMELMADASKQRDPIIKVKLMNCSARLMEAYSKGALALQRLQTGASQVVQVQHVQVNGQAVIGNVGGRV